MAESMIAPTDGQLEEFALSLDQLGLTRDDESTSDSPAIIQTLKQMRDSKAKCWAPARDRLTSLFGSDPSAPPEAAVLVLEDVVSYRSMIVICDGKPAKCAAVSGTFTDEDNARSFIESVASHLAGKPHLDATEEATDKGSSFRADMLKDFPTSISVLEGGDTGYLRRLESNHAANARTGEQTHLDIADFFSSAAEGRASNGGQSPAPA